MIKKNKIYVCCLAITLMKRVKGDQPALDSSQQSCFNSLLHIFLSPRHCVVLCTFDSSFQKGRETF